LVISDIGVEKFKIAKAPAELREPLGLSFKQLTNHVEPSAGPCPSDALLALGPT
jgi:hypothetical protein